MTKIIQLNHSDCGLYKDDLDILLESPDYSVVNGGCCQCPCKDDNCLLSYFEFKKLKNDKSRRIRKN